jgi:DNA-binding NarL/FixJ family response regulator
VVIVDENFLCRLGLRSLLQEDGRFEVAGEADQSDTGLKTILEEKPDVAVLDASAPAFAGIELAAALRTKDRGINVVILSLQKEEKLFNRAISAGVRGYALKKSGAKEILDCIATVARGESYVSSTLTDFLLRRGTRAEKLGRRKPGIAQLTIAERRVLKRVAHGKTSREIATECGISPRTVDSHRAHISEKLGIKGRNRLLHFALEHRDALNHLE